MSCTTENPLSTELAELECHFTWDLKKDDTNITDHLGKLEQNEELSLGNKGGVARTHNSLAYVRYLLGSYDEALQHLQKSVELSKEYYGDNCDERLIVTYGNFAWLHYHRERYEECRSYLEKLREIKTERTSISDLPHEVLGEKAWALFKFSRKYYNRAKECFRKALELEPEEGEWNAGYAIVLHRTTKRGSRQNPTVIQQLRRAIDTNPDNDEPKLLLALKLAEIKQFEEAEELVEKALETSPDSPHVIRYVGKFFRNYGSLDRSISLLKRVLDLTPNSSFIHHQLGLCYKQKKEQFREQHESKRYLHLSIFHFEKAIAWRSDFILAMSQLALLYSENEQIDRADRMFQTTLPIAKEKNEGLQALYLNYGEFQQYRKRCKPLAIKYYKDCFKLAPSTKDGKKSAKNLGKIANKRLSYNSSDTRALEILEFIGQVTGETRSHVESCSQVLESTCNGE